MPTSHQADWMYSFIGSDCVWPLPPVGMVKRVRSGSRGPKPASATSLRAASRSVLTANSGRPNQGEAGATAPEAGFAKPLSSATTSSRLIARLAARRSRMSRQGEPSSREGW